MKPRQAELRIPVIPDCDAILICAYDGRINPGSHRMRVLDGGWTAWLPTHGTVRACPIVAGKWSGAAAGRGLLLPPAPRDHELAENTSMLSVRFRLQSAAFTIQKPLPPLTLPADAAKALTRTGRRLVKQIGDWLQPSADRNSPGTHRFAPGDTEHLLGAMQARAAFAAWVAVFFKTAFEAGWRPFQEQSTMNPLVATIAAELTRFDGSVDQSIAGVAVKAGISPSHLRRLFHQNSGMAPAVFRDQARLHEAEKRLSASAAAIKEIAYDLGFASPSHFTNWFRAHTQQSPSAYRANARLPGV